MVEESALARWNRKYVKEFSEHKHVTTPGELLSRLKAFSWLSFRQLTDLAGELSLASFKRNEVVLDEVDLSTGANILLSGVAKISCLNARGQRVTVALLAPGPIPEFPSQSASPWGFRCEAYSDCRLGSVSWDRFNAIAESAPQITFREFHQNYMGLQRTVGEFALSSPPESRTTEVMISDRNWFFTFINC